MTNDFRPIRSRLELEFAEMLAPDLLANGADRVHIVLTSETDLLTCGEFSGLQSPRMHRWLRDYIPRWTGPAPAMLIDDGAITRDSVGRWQDAEDRLIGIAVHELAHVACTDGLYARDDEHTVAISDVVRQVFVEAIASPATFYPPGVSPRAGHGAPWIRMCCHLVQRMRLRGWSIYLPQVIDSDWYAYSSTSLYARALGDECLRLLHLPLTSLVHFPMPQAFTDLWNTDLARWPDGEL